MVDRNAPVGGLGLDLPRQNALFRLRARLTWRQFMREPGQIAGLIGFLLFFVPVSIALGVGSAFGYLALDAPWPGEILAAILTLVWIIWILAPLLSYRLNEGLDLTRLMIYPLRRRDLLAASVAGTIFDLPSYLTLPVVIAIFVGWTTLPLLPILIIGVLIWYGQLMLTSQMVLHASGGLLRSRRFRDLSIVIFSLFGMSCYFTSQAVNFILRDVTADNFRGLSLLAYVQWTPPGAVARAIERGAAGDWGASLLWLVASLFWLGVIAWGWWRVTTRLLTGASIFGGTGAAASQPVARRASAAPSAAAPSAAAPSAAASVPASAPRIGLRLLDGLPFALSQIAIKELLLTWRVPQRRIQSLQGLIMPIIFALLWGLNPWGGDGVAGMSPWIVFVLPGYTLLAVWGFTQNMLGWEGSGLQSLLLTPVRRRTIFAGKAVGLLLQVAGTNALLALLLGLVLQTWWALPGWIVATGVALAGMAVTMPGSVRFAHPVNLESTSRGASATGGGCLTGLANGLLIPLVTGIVNLPTAGLFAFLYWQNVTWMLWPAALMSLGYGLALFGLGMAYAERLLLSYEPEVIEATSKPGAA